jgi:hypothetical protein
MAEISSLIAAIYLNYQTSLIGDTNYSPGINSRFELFFDTRFKSIKVSSEPFFQLISAARVLDKI